uniref:Uncharacterized protein n=1 Tax=Ursus maritimus TaxID=29073 RepID=A0A452U2I9_URSMA
ITALNRGQNCTMGNSQIKKIQLKWMQSEQRVEEMLKNRAGRCLMNSFYFKPPKSE